MRKGRRLRRRTAGHGGWGGGGSGGEPTDTGAAGEEQRTRGTGGILFVKSEGVTLHSSLYTYRR